MIPGARKNHIVHFQKPARFVVVVVEREKVAQGDLSDQVHLSLIRHNPQPCDYGRPRVPGTGTARRCAGLRSVRSRSSVFVAFAWGRSCMEPYRSEPQLLAKPSVRIGGRPTELSVTRLQRYASSSCGRKTQLRISLTRFTNSPASRARRAPLSDISAATAIGRATRKPRSLPKFSNAKACAMCA